MTCILVEMDESDKPVNKDIALEIKIMSIAPTKPAWPTVHPVRKKRIKPKIVRAFGVNTPEKLPNRPFDSFLFLFVILVTIFLNAGG